MKLFILFFSIFLFAYSCHDGDTNVINGENKIITQFPKIETPKSEKTKIKILGINNLYIIDTFLIAFKATGVDDFFEIYSTSNFQYLGKCLALGNANNEFLSLQYSNEFNVTNDEITLWLYDYRSQKRTLLNLSQTLKQGKAICNARFRIGDFHADFSLNDSTIALFKYTPENINIQIQNFKNKQTISKHKLLKSNIPQGTPIGMLFAKHPTKNIFVAPMANFNQINIFTADLKSSFSLSYQQPPISIDETINLPDSLRMLYYSSVVPTSEYIYALYINQKSDKFYHSDKTAEVHVFNWDGEPISKIMIPDNLLFFAVDEKYQYIYGLNSKEEIFRYKLES